ncbi:hypothetical protein [Polaribacter gochangensis]|uniref:hypothetical protein n=1 Tax=Polaribacter gochangensis TaxID=3252903 RepID=UPI003904D614
MGENKHIKEIDAFAKKYVKEIPTETPSVDFTSKLMKSIAQLAPVKSTLVYKPLISKKGWFFVALSIITVVLVPFNTNTNKEEIVTLPKLDFSFLTKLSFSSAFENLAVSNTIFIITVIFGLFLLVQILFIKGFFEKKLH